MSKRIAVPNAAVALCAATMLFAGCGEAMAQANVLKECGSKYQATKSAGELKGQTWQDFLKKCREDLAAPAAAPASPPVAETPKPVAPPPVVEAPKPVAPPPVVEAPKPVEPMKPATAGAPKPASEGAAAMRARQKACAAEWKEKKAELRKTNPSMKWPKYWSECNARLKAGGQ